MAIIQQQLIRKFRQSIRSSWEQHKINHNIPDNQDSFIEFLIDNEIIKTEIIRRFTIAKEFHERAGDYKTKSELISLLSERYKLSKRAIWNYIRE